MALPDTTTELPYAAVQLRSIPAILPSEQSTQHIRDAANTATFTAFTFTHWIYTNLHEYTQIWIYTNIHKSEFTRIYTNIHKSEFTRIYTNLHEYTQIWIYTNIHKSELTWIYTNLNLHKFTQIYTNLNLHEFTQIWIYTNLHEFTQKWIYTIWIYTVWVNLHNWIYTIELTQMWIYTNLHELTQFCWHPNIHCVFTQNFTMGKIGLKVENISSYIQLMQGGHNTWRYIRLTWSMTIVIRKVNIEFAYQLFTI